MEVGSWMVSSSDSLVILNLKSLTTYGLFCFPVFNVITYEGNKIRDQEVINGIQRVKYLSFHQFYPFFTIDVHTLLQSLNL